MRYLVTTIGACICVCPALGNLVVNGSFEADGTISASNVLTGWTVLAGDVDTRFALSGGSTATDGDFLVDLDGDTSATIEQTVSGLVIGAEYEFSFDVGANSGPALLLWELEGASTIADTLSTSTGPLETVMTSFIAASETLTIRFTDLPNGLTKSGVALDNVRLIPSPAGSAVLVAVSFGAARRRRS